MQIRRKVSVDTVSREKKIVYFVSCLKLQLNIFQWFSWIFFHFYFLLDFIQYFTFFSILSKYLENSYKLQQHCINLQSFIRIHLNINWFIYLKWTKLFTFETEYLFNSWVILKHHDPIKRDFFPHLIKKWFRIFQLKMILRWFDAVFVHLFCYQNELSWTVELPLFICYYKLKYSPIVL